MTLTKEQKKEAERLFNLMRRIYNPANIKDNFNHKEYSFDGGLSYVEIDFTDLSDQDKFALVVIAFDLDGLGVSSSTFKCFGWDKKQVYKLAKNEKAIYSTYLMDVDYGKICGKGYVLSPLIREEMKRMYKEYLWHDISEEMPEYWFNSFLFDVDIPNVGKGIFEGSISNNKYYLLRPSYITKDLQEMWSDGLSYKKEIEVSIDFIKRWTLYDTLF